VFEVTNELELRQMMKDPNLEGTLILDCYADWCGPCKKLTPMLEEEVKDLPNVRLAKLNVDQFEKVPEMLKVSAIPAVFAFHKGDMIATFVGIPQQASLKNWVENVADPQEILAGENAAENKQ
jgi:thioredoxin